MTKGKEPPPDSHPMRDSGASEIHRLQQALCEALSGSTKSDTATVDELFQNYTTQLRKIPAVARVEQIIQFKQMVAGYGLKAMNQFIHWLRRESLPNQADRVAYAEAKFRAACGISQNQLVQFTATPLHLVSRIIDFSLDPKDLEPVVGILTNRVQGAGVSSGGSTQFVRLDNFLTSLQIGEIKIK